MNFVRQIKQWTNELNLFELETIRSEFFDRRKAIIGTRIYITLLPIFLTILFLYSALQGQNRTVTVQNPSELEFQTLLQQYPNTLSCPCLQMTIPYELFVEITLEYHPICSSIFISDIWINLLFNYNISYYYPLDFRSSSLGQFQILSSLCSLSKQFLNQQIQDLLSETFLTPIVLSPYLLNTESQSRSSFIRTSASNAFLQLLQLIRSATYADMSQTAVQTSRSRRMVVIFDGLIGSNLVPTYFSDRNDTICYCDTQSTCSSSLSGFFNLSAYETLGDYASSQSLISKVPGFVAGCFPLESLLQSSLECLYDLQCLNLVLNYFPHINTSNITYLNRNKTKYSIDTFVNTLVENLFIEQWTINNSFTKYYNTCAPLLCTYTFIQYGNILYVITQILGFYGGLVIVLRFGISRFIIKFSKRVHNQSTENTQTRLIDRLQIACRSIPDQLKQLNLFKKYDATRNDPYELQTSRIATRTYIVLFPLTMCILIIYASVNVRTQTFTISQPSHSTFENLHMEYSSKVKCPCKQSYIPYDSFLSLSPEYHPVCSSLFISSAWLLSLLSTNWVEQYFSFDDFHATGIVSQFQLDTIANFKQNLDTIRLLTMNMEGTSMTNSLSVSYKSLNTTEPYIDFSYVSSDWNDCSCALNDDCIVPMAFYEYPNSPYSYPANFLFNIPGLFIGCFAIRSVLQSSLECFYNETCLDLIQTMIRSNQSIDIVSLNQSQTRYLPNSSIEIIFNELMLEKWGDEIQYDRYYEQCAPISCTYTITKRNDLSYILTFLIALFGGVSIALKILVSSIVRWIRNRSRPKHLNPGNMEKQRLIQRLSQLFNQLKRKIQEYNIFESELSWLNEQRRQKDIITTRIYFLLLLFHMIILITFTSLSIRTKFITIDYPTQSILNNLRLDSRISSTLECSCQQITIPYSSFISIDPHFHQLCSSDFTNMNSNWTNVLYSYGIDDEHPYDDYRLFALPHFRTLSSLCNLSKTTVINNLNRFSSKTLISKQIQSYDTIQSQIENAVTRFRSALCRIFVLILNFIRQMFQGNGILSSIYSNWYFQTLRKESLAFLWTKPRSYGNENNCSCGTNSMCSSSAIIENSSIPGFRIGCYVIDSLLQSTLECLYNISCTNLMKSFYSVQDVTVVPLNTNLSSTNETVQSLVDRLLIDEWKFNISYENYYRTCSPRSCRYSIEERADPLYIIITIIGFYGGLSVALKIVAPLLMNIGRHFFRRFQNRIGVENPR
ncbi:hypothetical protein I4U23_015834 [Adineta vaga]|nr:hypothetical protein I4U23_015834 [Adineta vaga]